MKTTGVIRRIDELGRIVIPKEIRRNLRIKDGENIEILIDNENVVLKKFSELDKLSEVSQALVETMNLFLKKNIIIADNDMFTFVSGSIKDKIFNKPISNQLIEYIKERSIKTENSNELLYLINEEAINCNYCLSTIIVNGDAIGLVMIVEENEKISETDSKICQFVSQFLAKMLED